MPQQKRGLLPDGKVTHPVQAHCHRRGRTCAERELAGSVGVESQVVQKALTLGSEAQTCNECRQRLQTLRELRGVEPCGSWDSFEREHEVGLRAFELRTVLGSVESDVEGTRWGGENLELGAADLHSFRVATQDLPSEVARC